MFAQLLMSKKCDINIPDDINGNSPLFLATTLKQVCWPALAEVTYFRVKLTFLLQIDTMKALIAAKADVNLVRIFIPVPQTLLIIKCHHSIMILLTYVCRSSSSSLKMITDYIFRRTGRARRRPTLQPTTASQRNFTSYAPGFLFISP